jgi:hypothetical protein
MSNWRSLSAEPGRESIPGRASAEPSPPLRAEDRAGDVSPLAWVALALVLLAGLGYLLQVLGGRSWAQARSRQSPGDPGSARGGHDSLLPAARSNLLRRNHHMALHDRNYLDHILRAELEQEKLTEAPGAAEHREPGPGDAESGLGTSSSSDDLRR